MQKLKLLCFAFFLAFKGFSGVQSFTYSVFFETNDYLLDAKSIAILEDVIKDIPEGSEFELYIQGHTDDVGTDESNIVLSENRAKRVKEFFIERGLNPKVINMEYYGEAEPLKPNNSKANRQWNRRVSVQLTTIYFKDIKDLEATLNQKTKTKFKVDASEKTVVEGKSGTKILMQSNSFVDKNGNPVNGDVNIEMEEALFYENFIGHNLTTVSKGRMLVSGGMFQVKATGSKGQELVLNEGKDLTVAVPTRGIDNGMRLFTSQTGSTWNPTGKKVSDKLELGLPPYPKWEYEGKRLPMFEADSSSYPQKPVFYEKPRKPNAPDKSKYQAHIKWYHFFSKKRREREAEERYERALKRHEKQIQAYEAKLKFLQKKYKQPYSTIEEYQSAVVAWRENHTKDSLSFYSDTVYVMQALAVNAAYDAARAQYEEDLLAWNELKAEKLEERAKKLEEMGVSDESLVENYMMTVSDLTWINIDRYYDMSPQMVMEVKAKDVDASDEKVFLVFKNINSMLPMYKSDQGDYVNSKVPKNEAASIFAYKVDRGKVYISFQDVNEKSRTHELDFKPTTFKELRKLLSSFNV